MKCSECRRRAKPNGKTCGPVCSRGRQRRLSRTGPRRPSNPMSLMGGGPGHPNVAGRARPISASFPLEAWIEDTLRRAGEL